MTAPRVAVVVGDPTPRSSTLSAALTMVAKLDLADPRLVVDLADLGSSLNDPHHLGVRALADAVASCDLAVFASPTRDGGCSEELSSFLDRFGAHTLNDVVAVPFLVDTDAGVPVRHDRLLTRDLESLGARVPATGAIVPVAEAHEPDTYREWLAETRPLIGSALVPHHVTAQAGRG